MMDDDIEFSEEFNTEQLIEYLDQYFGKKSLKPIKEKGIDGKTFKTLKKDDLQKMGISGRDQDSFLIRISELNRGGVEATVENNSDDIFVMLPDTESTTAKHSSDANFAIQESSFMTPHVQKSDFFDVNVHVLLPALLWGWKSKNCSLFMCFEVQEREGLKYPLTLTGAFYDGYLRFEQSLQIPVDVIIRHNYQLAYKYYVVTDLLPAGKSEDLSLLCSGFKYKDVSRQLQIEKNLITSRTTQKIYDVPVYPDNDFIIPLVHKEVIRYFKFSSHSLTDSMPTDRSQVETTTLYHHLHKLKSDLIKNSFLLSSSTVSQMTKDIVSIYRQIFTVNVQVAYWLGGSGSKQSTGTSGMSRAMCEWVIDIATNASENSRFVIIGSVLLMVMYELKLIKVMPVKELQYVMKLVHVNSFTNEYGEKICPEFSTLKNCLSNIIVENKFGDVIKAVCRHIISETKGKSKDWLYAIPLYHFFFCVKDAIPLGLPYKPPSLKVNEVLWTFWPELKQYKENFQKHILSEYGSYEKFWLEFESLIDLDAAFMKVLIYLCPQDKLSSILHYIHPVVVCSFLKFICSEQKRELPIEIEKHFSEEWFKNLFHSIELHFSESWITQGEYLFSASHILVNAVVEKILGFKKNHLPILREMFIYFLDVISNLCYKAKLEKQLDFFLEKAKEALCSWMNSSGSCITRKNLNVEIQIWKMFYSLQYSETICSAWKKKLKSILETRSEQVPIEEKLMLFHEFTLSEECPEIVTDVFIKIGIDGLSSLGKDDKNEAIESLLKRNESRVSKLLSQVVLNRFGNKEVLVSIDELLKWEMWPNFIEIANTSNSFTLFSLMNPVAKKIINSASQKVLYISSSIESGDISFEDFEKLLTNKSKTQHLIKGVNINVFENVLKELYAFNDSITTFFQYIRPGMEEYDIIDQEYRTSISSLHMNELCVNWQTKRNIFVRGKSFGLASPFYPILMPFAALDKCKLFNRIWRQHCDKIYNEHSLVTQQQFIEEVWNVSIHESLNFIGACIDGSAFIAQLEKLFDNLSQDELKRELEKLYASLTKLQLHLFHETVFELPEDNSWVVDVVRKFESYILSKRCEDSAKVYLKLKERLKLQGSFDSLESIAKKKEVEYKLKDIGDQFLDTSDLLRNFTAQEKLSCLQCLTDRSWEIVEWINDEFQDLNELQTFVDVAYTTATGEDELNILKLNSLRFIGKALANFIPVLGGLSPIVSQQEDCSSDLIKLCDGLWDLLEQNSKLPSLLLDCKANIEWYKSVKASHGDVQLTTLDELKMIRQSGFFVIGGENNAASYKISDVLSLFVQSTTIEIYDFERLQDLESRLVLIAGQNAENTEEVQDFLNVFHIASMIADTLVKLNMQGCVKYIRWQCGYDFGQSCKENKQKRYLHLEYAQKYMSEDLCLWEEAVDAARNECYALNSYTTKQLLLLRSKLKPTVGGMNFDLKPDTFSLLKCLCPYANMETTIEVIKQSWDCMQKEEEENLSDANSNNVESSKNQEEAIVSSSDDQITIIVDEIFDKNQRILFVELTEKQGLGSHKDKLWVIAQILQQKDDKITAKDILLYNAECTDDGIELNEETLLKSIEDSFKNLGIKQDLFNVKKEEKAIVNVETQPLLLDMLDIYTEDYLSLSKLMMLLRIYIHKMHQLYNICISRQISEMDFQPGFPNLYVTSEVTVLQTVLAVYAKNMDMPLPTQEEILICDENTTAEEVVLLWRRAISDPDYKRIFCLVHGEKLSYATCEVVLQELNRLKQGKTGYNLLIICSNEYSTKSHLVTALHSYRRSYPVIDIKILKKYLQKHLINPSYVNIGSSCNSTSTIIASSVDLQKSYVRIVYSTLSGNGKSLYIQRLAENLTKKTNENDVLLHIPIHGPEISKSMILKQLFHIKSNSSKLIHLDIANLMVDVVENLLFSILVMGNLKDHMGNTWRREIEQMYLIEITFTSKHSATYHLLDLFPSVFCVGPGISQDKYQDKYKHISQMDDVNLTSEEYQRVYHYLSKFGSNDKINNYLPNDNIMNSSRKFFEVIQRYTTISTWSDIHRYVQFLNVQLTACEQSVYCIHYNESFKTFVIRMMLQMSKEFTKSAMTGKHTALEQLQKYQLNHSWNDGFHPYLFFNNDQDTFTFMGFYVNEKCDAVDPNTQRIIIQSVLQNDLRLLLKQSSVDLSDNYLKWKKKDLLSKLALVIGLEYEIYDPDPSYVITADNVMKMMAILMRFRCGIPVVMMGETGCGKTRLLKYLCELAFQDNQSIVILKIHGGTTQNDIEKAVEKAEANARNRFQPGPSGFGTVLFFDEANTSDHINLIKEIMCDHKFFGRKLHKDVKFVASCNPYRKHTMEMIERLESAGLGFYAKATQTRQRLGSIPLRHLVYRVHDLPSSLMSLVFDFGRLDNETEQLYVEKIVENKLKALPCFNYSKVISEILSQSQIYMKSKKDECAHVSLRDVDRAMTVFQFFYELAPDLTPLIIKKAHDLNAEVIADVEPNVTRALILTLGICYHARLEHRHDYEKHIISAFKRPLQKVNTNNFVNELRCCQEVFLDNMKLGRNIARNSALRENVFMMVICISLRIPLFVIGKPGSSKSLAKSIIHISMKGSNSETMLLRKMKEVQIFSYQCSQLSTSESILKLFSQASNVQNKWDKSKYVTVVVLDEIGLAEDSANLPLKVLHPLLEDGTEGNSYSVNVIDREERVAFIGISNWALDPAKMNRGVMVIRSNPSLEELQDSALQICSEEGVDKDIIESMKWLFKSFAEAYQEVLEKQKHTQFYGLRDFYSLVKMLFWMCKSVKQPPNWAQIQHAIRRNFSGHSSDDEIDIVKLFNDKIPNLPSQVDKTQSRNNCEGMLRTEFKKLKCEHIHDLLFQQFCDKNYDMEEEIQKIKFNECCKNGDFLDQEMNKIFEEEFQKYFDHKFEKELWPFIINPDCSPSSLIISSLANKERTLHGENRYLLFLTENYAALQTLRHFLESPLLLEKDNNCKPRSPYILFGSSFPKDKDFTQVYRNINNIKVCMETGRMVILLNLDELYESLYDVLNQYYVYYFHKRFVDLGLQNHRVKCSVHDNFKLILIAEKEKVYKEFPLALINRLEKHFIVTSTILNKEQLQIEQELCKFVKNFCFDERFKPHDSFIGYQDDTLAAIVFTASRLFKSEDDNWHEKMMEYCKFLLLQIATPDALVRLNNNKDIGQEEYESIVRVYTEEQYHSSLQEFLKYQMDKSNQCRMQVTTCNDLLSNDEIKAIKKGLNFEGQIVACILQEFDTEFSFTRKVRECFQICQNESSSMLIVQCDSGHLNSELIACAKYRVDDIWEDMNGSVKYNCYVLFTVLIPREYNQSSFVSFLGGDWICSYIDDFFPETNISPVTLALNGTPLSKLFYDENETISFNHCKFMYKNITATLTSHLHLEHRRHELNNTLHHLLHVNPPMNCDFYTVCVLFVLKYLQKYEYGNQQWITGAASEVMQLQEGGAFDKVLLRHLDFIIQKTLAELISFADRNYNLALIDPNNGPSPHLRAFWISAFSNLFEHTHKQTTNHENIQEEIYDYQCQFPFSYILQPAVQAVVKIQEGIESDGTIEDHLLIKINLLNEISETHFEEMKLKYINDLIQRNWFCTYKDEQTNIAELKVISKAVILWVDASISKKENLKFSDLAYAMHRAVAEKHYEITQFKKIIDIFPSILNTMVFNDSLPLHTLAAINALDLIQSDICNQQLEKRTKTTPRIVISQLHSFHQASSVIDAALYSKDTDDVAEARLKWQALQAVNLFLEHIVMNHVQYIDRVIQFLQRIITVFVIPSVDFTQKLAVRQLELLLSKMYKDFAAIHSLEADDFAQSCIKFYVAVISNLTMGRGVASDELIDKLMETIFFSPQDSQNLETRELTPFLKSPKYNDSVPVIRSYILQLLLQKNIESTRKHIHKYFEKAEELISSRVGNSSDNVVMQLKLLYCQLYENSLHEIISSDVSQFVNFLNMSKQHLNQHKLDLVYLEAVATVRYILQYICEWIVTHKERDEQHIKILTAVEKLCKDKVVNSITSGPQVYLLKNLYKRCGESGLRNVTSEQSIDWVWPERIHDNKTNRLLDYFAIYESEYTLLRMSIITVLNENNIYKLSPLSSSSTSSVYFILSLFMEVTQNLSKPLEDETRIAEITLQVFRNFVRSQIHLKSDLQRICFSLLDNAFCGERLVESLFVQPKQSLEDKIYSSIVVHVAAVFTERSDIQLIKLFHGLMTDPVSLSTSYIPSMPEDFAEDARRLFGGRVYVCANNHPYLITECGRPMEERTCTECKKQGLEVIIGGTYHQLRAGNKDRGNQIQTGYILGLPIETPAFPERSLSPAVCTIVKILIHSSLIWACCAYLKKEEIRQIVSCDIEEDELPMFFWKHLIVNCKSLQNLLSVGLDDIALLVHLILSKVLTAESPKDQRIYDLTKLEDKYEWEKQFDQVFIRPVLKSLHSNLETSRRLLLEDDRSTHPPFLDYVYERNIKNPDIRDHLWKYRPAITLEHLIQEMEVGGHSQTYPALFYFLREEVSLRATKYLPAIFQLQQYLYGIHHYRSSFDELQNKSVNDFLSELPDEERSHVELKIEQVNSAWKLVRGKLRFNGYFVNDSCISSDFTHETTLVHLIPRQGCCTTALVDYLVTIHNNFIDICMRIVREMHASGKTWKSVCKDPKVNIKNLHTSQLLNYDGKLMAVILAHCHYSLVVGSEQPELEYDFAALEKHLLNEFVYGKPQIQCEPFFVEYRKDVYTGMKFEMIARKVKPLIPLSSESKLEVLSKLNRIQQLRQALDHIDIVMGFLSSGGNEDGHMPLMDYASRIFKITDFNKVVGEGYCLGHIRSLWETISVKLAIEVTFAGETAYNVLHCFHEPLSEAMEENMDKKLEQMDLMYILSLLNEFIEIHVRNAKDNEARWTIVECLEGYLGEDLPLRLSEFFGDIPLSYIMNVWKKVVFYHKKHQHKTK